MKCRACNSEMTQMELVPYMQSNPHTLYMGEGVKTTTLKDVPFYYCNKCHHGQIDNIKTDYDYQHYNAMIINGEKNQGGSKALSEEQHYRDILIKIRDLVGGGRLLDIGCGQGVVMTYAKDYFAEVIGVEPSVEEAKIAVDKGHVIYNQFFDESFPERGFDVFISTQLFEHLENPANIMRQAYQCINENGIGYIDVPNGAVIYSKNQFYDVFAEHINYWSIESLSNLACNLGFSVIWASEIMNGQHIGIMVQKRIRKYTFDSQIDNSYQKLKKICEEYKHVSFWGAGVKGRNYYNVLCYMGLANYVEHIFDNSDMLHGLRILDDLPSIEKPTKEVLDLTDVVVITALQYSKEIQYELRNRFNYNGQIELIDC